MGPWVGKHLPHVCLLTLETEALGKHSCHLWWLVLVVSVTQPTVTWEEFQWWTVGIRLACGRVWGDCLLYEPV